MTKVNILNVRIPDDIISWLDDLVKKGLYDSRSEAIREILREEIETNG